MDKKTDKEIEALLNPDNKSEEWPEFEIIKNDVVDFMSDLPIEVYEHLLKACHLEPDRLTQHLLDFISEVKTPEEINGYNCFNHCPKCDATDPNIDWGDKDWGGDSAWQSAICQECGCEFTEIYIYNNTEIDSPLPSPLINPDE